jgi:hypothetical protein
MSNKSRHVRRKFSTLSKGKREKQRSLATTGLKPVITPIPIPVPHHDIVNSKVSMPVSSVTPDTEEYHYMKAELLRVGILTGIIFFIMIVLALVLR